jgi:hypothetical protein
MIKKDLILIEEEIEDINRQLSEEARKNLENRRSMLEEFLEGQVNWNKRLACLKDKLYRKNWKKNLLKKSICTHVGCGVEEGVPHECDLGICPTCGSGIAADNPCNCDNTGKEKVPFIDFPIICEYCGEIWPESFTDDEWKEILPECYWDKTLCLDCWKYIKELITSSRASKKLTKIIGNPKVEIPLDTLCVDINCLYSSTEWNFQNMKSILEKSKSMVDKLKTCSVEGNNADFQNISQELLVFLNEIEEHLDGAQLALMESIDSLGAFASEAQDT